MLSHPIIRVNASMAVLDPAGDATILARPEPDLDERVGALHRVPSATSRIEGGAVAVRRRRGHAAAGIVRRSCVAVVPRGRAVLWQRQARGRDRCGDKLR